MTAPSTTVPARDIVELEVPADAAYVAVVRTATAGLAARLDLTLDRIEDLRIAIDEACTLLLQSSNAGTAVGTISCLFTLDEGALSVEVSGPSVGLPQPQSYSWAVLSALVDQLTCGQDNGRDADQRTWLRLVVHADTGPWS